MANFSGPFFGINLSLFLALYSFGNPDTVTAAWISGLTKSAKWGNVMSFQSYRQPTYTPQSCRMVTTSSAIFAMGRSDDDDKANSDSTSTDEKVDSSVLPTNFNPFEAIAGRLSTNTVSSPTPSTQVSLRDLQMKHVTSHLLELVSASSSDETISSWLDQHESFLLEPLLETYTDDQNELDRRSKFQQYENTIMERIQSARNPTVRKTLETLRDYVMSKEEKDL